MSTASRLVASASTSSGLGAGQQPPPLAERSYFEQQRELVLKDIGISFEHVLANINKLNRSLEGVIAVGNEFSSVEALWSLFEGVMGKDVNGEREGAGGDGAGEGEAGRDGGAGSDVGKDREVFDVEEEEVVGGKGEGRRR